MTEINRIEIAAADGRPINDLIEHLAENHKDFLGSLGEVRVIAKGSRQGGEGEEQRLRLVIDRHKFSDLSADTCERIQAMIASFLADGVKISKHVENNVLHIKI